MPVSSAVRTIVFRTAQIAIYGLSARIPRQDAVTAFLATNIITLMRRIIFLVRGICSR